MRLRFKVQRYQTEAVDAVAGCFAGQPRHDPAGDPEPGNAEIALSPPELLENIQAVQRARGLPLSSGLAGSPAAGRPDTPNLDVEMETGTGKTYVYIKTIMELHRRYGWSKFIVVVPSIAIRAGVARSFEITAAHFQRAYGSTPHSFCYSSSRLHEIERFASDAGVQVMIINIQAFNAAGADSRRIYDVLDALTRAGLLRRIQPSRSVARYESRVGDNHHHIVCRSCGAVADIDCAAGVAPCLVPADDHGYSIDEAEVIYWGLCPDCSAARKLAAAPHEQAAATEHPHHH